MPFDIVACQGNPVRRAVDVAVSAVGVSMEDAVALQVQDQVSRAVADVVAAQMGVHIYASVRSSGGVVIAAGLLDNAVWSAFGIPFMLEGWGGLELLHGS